MKQFSTRVEINASPESVWRVFSDLESFHEWNPFITKAKGEFKVGTQLELYVQPTGGKGRAFHPKVLTAERNKEVSWRSEMLGFAAEQVFKLEQIGDKKTRLIQSATYTGLVTAFRGEQFVDNGVRGFEEMERALKERVEKDNRPELGASQ